MPNYDYECDCCGFKFRVSHSITKKLVNCIECDSENSLFRYSPSGNIMSFVDKSENKRIGVVVEESIEDFRTDLKDQKRQLKNRSFDE